MSKTNSSSNKVKFAEPALDDYVQENSVLKSKLQSKTEALSIMGRELDKCAMERDRYRLILQQVRSDTRALSLPTAGAGLPGRPVTGGELLAATRDHNNQLKLELEALRLRYEECARDAAALRTQLRASAANMTSADSKFEDTDLVRRLEILNNNYAQVRRDLSAALDEKEELAADRDHYKSRLERLTRHLAATTAVPGAPCRLPTVEGIDVTNAEEALDMEHLQGENERVRESLALAQAENRIVRQTLAKYRNLLKSRIKKAGVDLTDSMDIITQQQVRRLVERRGGGENRTLCHALLDVLGDKCVALQHQRKSNRVLATRIADLEKTLESWAQGSAALPPFPSQLLLDEFQPDTPDASRSPSRGADSDRSTPSEDSDSSEPPSGREGREVKEDIVEQKVEAMCTGEGRNGRVVLPPELEEMVCEALKQIQAA